MRARSQRDGTSRATLPVAQPFVLCSLLGIAWSIAHSGLEMLMGSGTLKVVGMFVALGWAILLWLAARGRRWTLYGAFIAGALACYYLAVAHFGPGVHVRWIGIVPWMLHPERAAGGWVTPYNLVVDAGVVIGVAIPCHEGAARTMDGAVCAPRRRPDRRGWSRARGGLRWSARRRRSGSAAGRGGRCPDGHGAGHRRSTAQPCRAQVTAL
jgi:hypothetical protein